MQRISDVEYISQAVRAKAEECLAAVDDGEFCRSNQQFDSYMATAIKVMIDGERDRKQTAHVSRFTNLSTASYLMKQVLVLQCHPSIL